MKEEILFYERQKLWRQWIALITFVILDLLFIWGFIQQIIFDVPWGNQPMSNIGLFITTLIVVLCSCLLLFVRLDTIVKEDGIYIKYFPFHFRTRFYSWDSIDKSHIRNYDPIREFGGWGLNFNLYRKGIYNVYGNIGLELIFYNGKKLMIGTNKPEELNQILKKIDAQRKQK